MSVYVFVYVWVTTLPLPASIVESPPSPVILRYDAFDPSYASLPSSCVPLSTLPSGTV